MAARRQILFISGKRSLLFYCTIIDALNVQLRGLFSQPVGTTVESRRDVYITGWYEWDNGHSNIFLKFESFGVLSLEHFSLQPPSIILDKLDTYVIGTLQVEKTSLGALRFKYNC